MVHCEPETGMGSGQSRRPAADVDEREALEEKAIVKRLGRFDVVRDGHANQSAVDVPRQYLRALSREESSPRLKTVADKEKPTVSPHEPGINVRRLN